MLRAVITTLLIISTAACSSSPYKELLLQDEKGKMLSQVSGLGKFSDWVVVLVQDQDDLYVIRSDQLASAYEQKQESIRLTPVTLNIEGLQSASWEAVEFAKVNGKNYVFLFHEHDYEGDNHQIYSAEVNLGPDGFNIAQLKKLGPTLPLLQNKDLSLDRRENYGYEAIVWDINSQRLLLLPELKTQPKYALSLSGELLPLMSASHNLRASDLTSISNQCAIATSFCYQSDSFSDALCTGNGGSPKLSLATFAISADGLSLVETQDHTKDLMPVGFDPNYSTSSSLGRTFNIEGIVGFDNGFLIANDNKPQGKSRSVLRFLTEIDVNPESCEFY